MHKLGDNRLDHDSGRSVIERSWGSKPENENRGQFTQAVTGFVGSERPFCLREKCRMPLRWVSWCSVLSVALRCPTVATNMLASHFSFRTCPHLLFNHPPRHHLLLKASNHTPFAGFPLSLNVAFTCLCGPIRLQTLWRRAQLSVQPAAPHRA